jgi:(R,R)-butanediol dehydrogenase/meso-butanediol dehydrogenase/diacetyl reductase
MRAARWHARRDVRVDTVAVDEPTDREVLIAVERTGLCGTDLEEYLHGPVDIPAHEPHLVSHRRAPIVLGHEVVGVVHACPGGQLAPGTRVIPDVVVSCGVCWWCRRHQLGLCRNLVVRGLQTDGGLAEYMIAEADTCVVVPDALSPDIAAFAEPASVAVRALRKAGDLSGATIVVVGCGTIGLLVAQVAAGSGALGVVAIDPNATRRRLAEQQGWLASLPKDAGDQVGEVTDGRGADVVVECSGTEAGLKQALALGRRGGVVVVVGTGRSEMTLRVRDIVLGEQRLVGSAAHVWDEDVAGAVALLAEGVVDPSRLITSVVDLEAVVEDGLDRLANDPDAMKILIAPRRTAG